MRIAAYLVLITLAVAFAGVSCGGEAEPAPAPTATEESAAQPTAAPTQTPPNPTATSKPTEEPQAASPSPAATNTPESRPTVAPTAAPDPANTPQPTDTPEPTPTPEPEPTATLEPSGVVLGSESFVVGEGSIITFTVEEELRGAPIRFDAVVSSTGLSGVANLDGSPSEVMLDLHSLQSDQNFRDRYIRERMFPRTPSATVIVDNLPDLPQSFFDGEETSGTLEGSLRIGDNVTPLTFDVDARHDGDVVNVLGRTTFTWDELGLVTPVAGPVVYLADEVRVQVLIIAFAQ